MNWLVKLLMNSKIKINGDDVTWVDMYHSEEEAKQIASVLRKEMLARLPEEREIGTGNHNFQVSDDYNNGFNKALSQIKQALGGEK